MNSTATAVVMDLLDSDSDDAGQAVASGIRQRPASSSTNRRPALGGAPSNKKACLSSLAVMVAHSVTSAFGRELVQYGSDCSGLDGGAFALRYNGTRFGHRFGSELNKSYRNVFAANHPDCGSVFGDITERDFQSFHQYAGVNVYTAGFPCQPFSPAGHGLGQRDSEGRGLVVWWVIMTISIILPWAFILENVASLATFRKHRPFFDAILAELRRVDGGAYEVEWAILCSRRHGDSAAARERVYIVGIRLDKKRKHWQWPAVTDPPQLDSVLERGLPCRDISTLTDTQLKHLEVGLQKIQRQRPGTNLTSEPWVIDINAGPNFATYTSYDHLPTITKSRGSSGFWVVKLDRFTTGTEHLRCQGFRPEDVVVPDGASMTSFNGMAGNAFTVSVFQRLWRQLLPAVGLAP